MAGLEVTVIVELRVPREAPLKEGDEKAWEAVLLPDFQEALRRFSYPLSYSRVESVKVAATAGEEKTIEVRFLLDDGQMDRAERAINDRLVDPIRQIRLASIDRRTRTLFAWCLLHNRKEGWVTVPLPPESIADILGKEE